jgi:polyhydroxybutyrate depolymerase
MRGLTFALVVASAALLAACAEDRSVVDLPSPSPSATALPPTTTPRPTRPPTRTPLPRPTPRPTVVRSSGCGIEHARGDAIEAIEFAGEVRAYRLHVPARYNNRQPAPVLLNFHGYAQEAAQQEAYSGLVPLSEAEGFVLVTPEGSGSPQGWDIVGVYDEDGSDDVIFVRDLMSQLFAKLCLDQRRIFATGHSNGAEMASQLACFAPDLVAAVAPVSGTVFQECPGMGIAMVGFQGTEDYNVPFEDSDSATRDWAAHNGCAAEPVTTRAAEHVSREAWSGCFGNDVVFYVIEGGGHTWPGAPIPGGAGPATNEIDASKLMWQFFAAHPKRQ